MLNLQSSVYNIMLEMKLSLVVLKCTMYNTTRVFTTAEKRLFMTSIWGIIGSFDEHNRLNLGHCSKA